MEGGEVPQTVEKITAEKAHLLVCPHVGKGVHDEPVWGGFDIYVTGDQGGKPDFAHIMASRGGIEGSPGDIEEIAETFFSRLGAGKKPEEIFQDIDEQSIAHMKKLSEQIRQ